MSRYPNLTGTIIIMGSPNKFMSEHPTAKKVYPKIKCVDQLTETTSEKELINSIVKRGAVEHVCLSKSERQLLDAILRRDPYWEAKGWNSDGTKNCLAGTALSQLL